MFGSTVVASGALGLMTQCELCLGPFGAFVVVFIIASAGGIIGMEAGKWFGDRIYDVGDSLNSRVYHSMDELIGAINE